MLEQINNYDWESAFSAACGTPSGGCYWSKVHVVEIIRMSNGEHEEKDWLGVFRLADGRIGMVESGCDYSGWD